MQWIPDYNLSEIHGTRQENFGSLNTPPSVNVQLLVKYSERYAAMRSLLWRPAEYPFSNDIIEDGYLLYCVNANVISVPSGYKSDDGQTIDYKNYAIINATYQARTGYYREPGSTSNNEYVDETFDPRMEALPVNNNYYKWSGSSGDEGSGSGGSSGGAGSNDPLAPEESPTRFEPGVTLVRTIVGLDTFDPATYELQGTTHNEAYTSFLTGHTYAAGTLMLRTLNAVREYSHLSYILGYPTWTVTLRYEHKPQTWNKFWRGGVQPPSYQNILLRSDDSIVYPFPLRSHSVYLFAH